MAERPKLVAMPAKPVVARWSPVDALEEFLSKVRSGEIKVENLMVFWIADDHHPHYWMANCSLLQQVAFGELIKAQALEEWKGD